MLLQFLGLVCSPIPCPNGCLHFNHNDFSKLTLTIGSLAWCDCRSHFMRNYDGNNTLCMYYLCVSPTLFNPWRGLGCKIPQISTVFTRDNSTALKSKNNKWTPDPVVGKLHLSPHTNKMLSFPLLFTSNPASNYQALPCKATCNFIAGNKIESAALSSVVGYPCR